MSRRALHFCFAVAVLPALLPALLVACAADPPTLGPGALLLSDLDSQQAVSRLLGKAPRKCLASRPGFELCGWALGASDGTWQEFADALHTRRRINVFCELPISKSSPEAMGSPELARCDALPRAALPYGVALRYFLGAPDVAAEPADGSRSAQARRTLDAASSMFELSRLVGEVPTQCLRRTETHQRCEWHLSNRTPGFRLVSAVIAEDGQVVLQCMLPYDGSPRDPEGCTVIPKG